jgi:hypothetical protein
MACSGPAAHESLLCESRNFAIFFFTVQGTAMQDLENLRLLKPEQSAPAAIDS